MAAWPSTLPVPLAAGYGVTPTDLAARTEMEAGPARVRQRSSARNDQVAVSWVFTDAQYAAFRAWFYNASTGISGGASWFTVRLAGLGVTTGLVSCEARFVGSYRPTHLGALKWSVSATLETR